MSGDIIEIGLNINRLTEADLYINPVVDDIRFILQTEEQEGQITRSKEYELEL